MSTPSLRYELLLAIVVILALNDTARADAPSLLWIGEAHADTKDTYTAFRGQWRLDAERDIELRLLGASSFTVWLNGQYFAEGPARFSVEFPQYQTYRCRLGPGHHTLAVLVHHVGLTTRLLQDIDPFLYCVVQVDGKEIPLRWRCSRLNGYKPRVRRINDILGFIEWCDTREVPDWQAADYDDGTWSEPVVVARKLGALEPLSIGNIHSIVHPVKPVATGTLVDTFGREDNDPEVRFFMRELRSPDGLVQGVWRRYDLGRVHLMRPRLVLDLPAGAIVEFAYSEALSHGRVSPWMTSFGTGSCNFDHYVARGGPQEFFPHTPKGGRFVEVHVLASPEDVHFLTEEAVERCYYDNPEGEFQCGDELLNRIWSVGVETHRACAEDALTDNPTRERGQWAGDAFSVGMDIAAVAFSDLRLCRRGLVQCAQCACPDGLVSGLPPNVRPLSTYAAQWVTACVHYWELSGDIALLKDLFPCAERNIVAFEKQKTSDGVPDSLGWGFVDWGYVRNPGPADMAVNLHYLAALRDMTRWCKAIGKDDHSIHYKTLAKEMSTIIERYFASELNKDGDAWARIGYHRAALGLWLGFFHGPQEKACLDYLKAHMLRCFPNDPSAPRLSDPSVASPQVITPYFAHYVMPLLIERGDMDFVLCQYRKCWGWALEGGRTTWPEVFDRRWSHCHQWAGCPTWQLARYVLGLHPRYDLGAKHYVLAIAPGSLEQASGRIPFGDIGKTIAVNWTKTTAGLHYRLTCPEPITLHLEGDRTAGRPRVVQVQNEFERTLKPDDGVFFHD